MKTYIEKYGLVLSVAFFIMVIAVVHFTAKITVSSANKKLPIYEVSRDDKKVAITFDAAWGNSDTEEILTILEQNDVKATFFLCGYWVDKYPESVMQIYEKGHELGSHGDKHRHCNNLSKEELVEEIVNAKTKIENITKKDVTLFRAPFGEYNNNVIDTTFALGLKPIQWDVDRHDWMNKGKVYELDQVLNNKNLSSGSIILFHNDAENTKYTLDEIIKSLKKDGYEIVTVSELIYDKDFTIDFKGVQKNISIND